MADNNKNTPLTQEEADDIRVTLNTDDGDIECRVITIFEVDNQDYIALLPLDEAGNDNAEDIIYLYRYYEDENGNPSIVNIIDEEEYDAAADRFDEWLDEQFYNSIDD